MVEVYAGANGPFRLIVDTGANRTVLDPSVATALGLVPGPEQRVLGVAGVTAAPMAPLSRLSVGDYQRTDVSVALIGGRVLAGAHGLLGMDFFEGRRMTLDFQHSLLAIEGSAPRRVREALVLAQGDLLHGTLMILGARLGDVRARALADTGATHTIVNPALGALLGAQIDQTGETARASTAAGAVPLDAVQLPLLAVGDLRVRRLSAFMADLDVFSLWAQPGEPAMVLGMDVWRLAEAVSIDYPRAEVQLRLAGHNRPDAAEPASRMRDAQTVRRG